jgi:hypothetical protein
MSCKCIIKYGLPITKSSGSRTSASFTIDQVMAKMEAAAAESIHAGKAPPKAARKPRSPEIRH